VKFGMNGSHLELTDPMQCLPVTSPRPTCKFLSVVEVKNGRVLTLSSM